MVKEVKKNKVLNENLLLAEVQLAIIKIKEEVIYNLETNNNYEIIAEKVETKSETIEKDAEKGKPKETKKKVVKSN